MNVTHQFIKNESNEPSNTMNQFKEIKSEPTTTDYCTELFIAKKQIFQLRKQNHKLKKEKLNAEKNYENLVNKLEIVQIDIKTNLELRKQAFNQMELDLKERDAKLTNSKAEIKQLQNEIERLNAYCFETKESLIGISNLFSQLNKFRLDLEEKNKQLEHAQHKLDTSNQRIKELKIENFLQSKAKQRAEIRIKRVHFSVINQLRYDSEQLTKKFKAEIEQHLKARKDLESNNKLTQNNFQTELANQQIKAKQELKLIQDEYELKLNNQQIVFNDLKDQIESKTNQLLLIQEDFSVKEAEYKQSIEALLSQLNKSRIEQAKVESNNSEIKTKLEDFENEILAKNFTIQLLETEIINSNSEDLKKLLQTDNPIEQIKPCEAKKRTSDKELCTEQKRSKLNESINLIDINDNKDYMFVSTSLKLRKEIWENYSDQTANYQGKVFAKLDTLMKKALSKIGYTTRSDSIQKTSNGYDLYRICSVNECSNKWLFEVDVSNGKGIISCRNKCQHKI